MRIEVLSSGSEAGNCYWVSDGHTHLLLDCGIPRKKIADYLHQHRLPGIDAVLVSHEHGDHSKAVKELLKMGRVVYMSKGTADALGVNGVIWLTQGIQKRVASSWWVTPFNVEHDAPEPLGFVIESEATGERLLYATDTLFIPPRYGDGCSHLLIEANYSLEKLKENAASGEVDRAQKHRVLWQHQSIDTVLKFLRETDRSRLQQVILLHLSDANSDEVAFKRRVAEIAACPVRIA